MNSSVLLLVVCAALLGCTLIDAKKPIILGEGMPEGIEYDGKVLTALQQYVATPDSNYVWAHHPEFDAQGLGYKVLWLNMTSQRWLTDADVSRSLWQHWIGVIVPNTLNPTFSEYGLEWIGGGHNDVNKPPSIWDKDLMLCAALSQELGAIVAAVYAIPNEPMIYYEEQPPKSRTEDAMIAWAWKHFIEDTSNPEWLPRLPMTKAAVRGMDAASEFWQQQSGNSLSSWLVAGASKRGWTTWTVGACDAGRVVAIIPMVLDELNFVQNIKHHFRAYGGWSFALTDYYALNFTSQLDSPGVAAMMEIVDPINYVDELASLPKLIVSTAGDEFLCPDNNDWYWPQLQGEKHFHSFPNLEHTMIENVPAVLETVRGFALLIMSGTPRPEYVWSKSDNGTITLEINAANPPSSVKLWHAYTIDGNARRDFRLVAIMNTTSGMKPWLHPVFWSGADLAPSTTSPAVITYEAYMDPPAEGWVGFVIEAEFPIAGTNATFRISTAQSILPQTFPYPECSGEECYGTLV